MHAPNNKPCAICAADLMINISYTCGYLELKDNSITWAIQALSLRTFVFGIEHKSSIEALIRAAHACFNTGEISRARSLGLRAVQLIEASDNYPPSLVAWKFDILAHAQAEDGLPEDECHEKALAIRLAVLGPDHPDILPTKDVLESYTRVFGRENLGTLEIMSFVASGYSVLGQSEEANRLSAEIASLDAGVSSLDCMRGLLSSLYQTAAHYKLGKYAEGITLANKALELSSEVNGLAFRDSVIAMNLLAAGHEHYNESQKHLTEAEFLRHKVLECTTKVGGTKNSDALAALGVLADHYESREMSILTKCQLGLKYIYQGEGENASKYLYSASQYPVESAQAKLLINTRRMVFIASHLNENDYQAEAEREMLLGKIEESEELYREAIDLASSENGIDKELPLIMTKLASVLLQAARYEDAKNMAFEASMMLSQLPELDERVASLNATTLATAYAEQGRYRDAELVSSSILFQKQRLLSDLKDLTISFVSRHLNVLKNLAQTYELSERHQQAKAIYKTVFSVRTQIKKPTHLRTLQTVVRNMGTLNSQARYAEALDLGLECDQHFHQRKTQSMSYDAHLLAAAIRRGIAVSHHGLGDPSYAEQFAREALESPPCVVGPVHPHKLDTLSVLVPILRDQSGEKLTAAKTKGEELLKGRGSLLGEHNINTIIQAMEISAETNDKLGDHEGARSLDAQAKELRKDIDRGLGGVEKRGLDELV
ncbi:uncharacterized protein BDV14DRAFT_200317 [Aspergillus stella-maris]|uniref:uncharacterized protein n=1 Tax=Aspergillus stella-maris TaxID=1810926 RepID=UPI003CCCD37B